MTNDIIKVIKERLKMLQERELLCADECRALRLLVEDIEQQYIKLPLDADGVPIRLGDTLAIEWGGPTDIGEVTDIHLREGKCSVSICFEYDSSITAYPEDYRHVKPETVEDIIAEAMSFACEPEAPYSKNSEHVRRFAERIRKAVEQ